MAPKLAIRLLLCAGTLAVRAFRPLFYSIRTFCEVGSFSRLYFPLFLGGTLTQSFRRLFALSGRGIFDTHYEILHTISQCAKTAAALVCSEHEG